MSFSKVVTTPDEDPGDALDLRAAAALDDTWRAAGFAELVPGELVRPVDVHLPDLAATHALGRRIAASLRPGDLVVLTGPLGAGKTSLTQGLGAGLGVKGDVTSPTFVLARTHRGPVPLTHVDAYRLREVGHHPGPGHRQASAARARSSRSSRRGSPCGPKRSAALGW